MRSAIRRRIRDQGIYVLVWTLVGLFFFSQAITQRTFSGDPTPRWHYLVAWLTGCYISAFLTLKRALPAPPAANLLAKMLMALLFAVIVMVTMIAAAISLGHLRLSIGQFFSLAVINILGALPFCALGLFIGTRASAKSAPAFVNLLYLPMIYLSGFFFPLPHSIYWIQFASPAFYLDQLALAAVSIPSWGAPVANVAVLVGVTLLLGALAVRRLARVG